MSNHKTHLSIAGTKDHPPIRPPANLWEILDSEYRNLQPPGDCFTIADYSARYRITYSKATGALERLEREGVVKMAGRFGSKNTKYYRLAL